MSEMYHIWDSLCEWGEPFLPMRCHSHVLWSFLTNPLFDWALANREIRCYISLILSENRGYANNLKFCFKYLFRCITYVDMARIADMFSEARVVPTTSSSLRGSDTEDSMHQGSEDERKLRLWIYWQGPCLSALTMGVVVHTRHPELSSSRLSFLWIGGYISLL